MDSELDYTLCLPGRTLARGVGRMLRNVNHASLTEFAPTSSLRADLISLAPDGEIWIIECKSSKDDFTRDRKWQGYLEWCDRYFWAVDQSFPQVLLSDDQGLIVADAYDAEILRMPVVHRMTGARRSKLTRSFARAAALRLQGRLDPSVISGVVS